MHSDEMFTVTLHSVPVDMLILLFTCQGHWKHAPNHKPANRELKFSLVRRWNPA